MANVPNFRPSEATFNEAALERAIRRIRSLPSGGNIGDTIIINGSGNVVWSPAGGLGLVDSVTGWQVDNTDPNNPVILSFNTDTSLFGDGSLATPLGVIGGIASDDSIPTVTAGTTAALAGTWTYNNGVAGVGATLTRTTNGALGNQDGISLVEGVDSLLVKNQVNQIHNGAYDLTQKGTAGTPTILTRRADSDETSEFDDQVIAIATGTTLAGTTWGQTTVNPTVGTNNIVYAAQTGTFVTQAPAGTQTITNIPLWTGQPRRLSKGTTNFQYNTANDLFTIRGIGYTFPADNGDANEVLTTDGAGNLTWEPVASGGASIGGAVTGGTQYSILFVDPADTIAEDNTGLNYNNSTNRLGLSIAPGSSLGTIHAKASGSTNAAYLLYLENTQGTIPQLFSIRNDGTMLAGYITNSADITKQATGILWNGTSFPNINPNGGTSGYGNVIISAGNSGEDLTNGAYNHIFSGATSGQNITTGLVNSLFGTNQLASGTSASYNSCFGSDSLEGVTTQNENCAFGFGTLRNTAAAGNSGFGAGAGLRNQNGTYNAYLGYYAGDLFNGGLHSFSYNVYLGSTSEANQAGECVIGNSQITKWYLGRGKFDPNVATPTDFILTIPGAEATGTLQGRSALSNTTSTYRLVLQPSLGTGTGTPGPIVVRYAPAGSTGTAANTPADLCVFNGDGKGITILTAVDPTASVADSFNIYSKDITAGNAAPHVRTENGDIVKLYKQALTDSTTGTANGSLVDVTTTAVADPVKINDNFAEIYAILSNLGLVG